MSNKETSKASYVDRMNIVHVLPALTKGGGEKVAVDLANHAACTGHEVTMLVGWPVDRELLEHKISSAVSVIFISSGGASIILRYVKLILWIWRQRIWLANQDIIHCHLTFGAIFGSVTKLLRRGKRPCIVETYHAVGMPIPWPKRWFHAWLLAQRDGIVLMAEDMFWRKFLSRHKHLISRTIPNGISITDTVSVGKKQQMNYRNVIGVPKSCRFIIGSLGRMAPDRQPWVYLPIFEEIARVIGPDVHFVLAGDGPELNRMRSLVEASGLEDKVHLPGIALDPFVPYSIMDLYITLNVGPLTGLAAMEAASSGVPVLAIQLLPEYQQNAEDWIWSSVDPLELAGYAVKLIQSPSDRQRLSEKQIAFIQEKHTTDAMVRSYYELYKICIISLSGDKQ